MPDDYTGLHGRRPSDVTAHHTGDKTRPPDYGNHYVPEGWEDLNRGICPACGRAVSWDPENERWVRDESLVVLVLTDDEVATVRDRLWRAGAPGPELEKRVASMTELNRGEL